MPPTPPASSEDELTEDLQVLAMPAVTSSDPLGERELEDYLEQLDHALGLVATYARHEPELTLWCCRRAGELVLRCLHLQLGAARLRKRHPTFQDLRSHTLPDSLRLGDVIGEANVGNLDTIQRQGNIGVHARRRGREEAWDGVGSAISALPRVVDRLFGDDLLGPGYRTDSLARNLALVQAGGRQEEPPQRRIDTLEAELRLRTQERNRLQARLQEAAQVLEGERETVAREARRRSRAEVEAELAPELGRQRQRAEAAEARVQDLEEALEAATRREAELTSSAATPPASPLWRVLKWTAAGLLLTGLTLSALVGVGIWSVLDGLLSSPSDGRRPTPPPAVVEAPAPEPLAVQAPEPVAASPAALPPPPPSCPDGSVLVDAPAFRLRPPTDRGEWPVPRRSASSPLTVATFCIDTEPVPQTETEAGRPCQGNPQSFDGPAPATCISRDEAADWCEQKGGGLPTIAQWEAIARTEVVDALSWQLDREWVADSFPPAVFGMDHATDPSYDALFRKRRLPRPETDGVKWSWNRHDGSARWTHFGFRCAYALEGT